MPRRPARRKRWPRNSWTSCSSARSSATGAAYSAAYAAISTRRSAASSASRARKSPSRPQDLAAYAGTYANDYFGPAQVIRRGDELVLKLGPEGPRISADALGRQRLHLHAVERECDRGLDLARDLQGRRARGVSANSRSSISTNRDGHVPAQVIACRSHALPASLSKAAPQSWLSSRQTDVITMKKSLICRKPCGSVTPCSRSHLICRS